MSAFSRGLVAALVLGLVAPLSARAQDLAVSTERLEAYGAAYTAIGELRDKYQADAAAPENKKAEAIEMLQAKLREDIAAVLQANGFTEDEYTEITYLISVDQDVRRAFNSIMGIEEEEPEEEPAVEMSDNPHIGHVLSSFAGTPGAVGLLAMAQSEADIAIQHAGLAAAAEDLAGMKTHTGHVVHAIAPEDGSRGPGSGYGLKQALEGIATHTDLAAKVEGASDNVRTHAVHVITATRATIERADAILALAEQIAAATSAEEAAPLVAEMNTLVGQLKTGVDADGDGTITWQQAEGGLDQVDQHAHLMAGG